MRTIERHEQINKLLDHVDAEATKAINSGLKFTIECRDNGITEKQFNAGQVWFRDCAKYLNDINALRLSPVTGIRIPWTERAFKEDIYKVLLSMWKNKQSTKDQNTKDPDEIRLAISGHLATAYKINIQLPEWPSNR